MKTRGKFTLQKVSHVGWNKDLRIYEFQAVCNDGTPENERFHRYTPSGTISITVDNPAVVFEFGKEYYVDFSEAVKA